MGFFDFLKGKTSRESFVRPVRDVQYEDPTRIGGGVGVQHLHGDAASTWTLSPDETERYRGLGEAAAKRQAYQADFGRALGDEQRGMDARGAQLDAAAQMGIAARGGAPSQASILGNQAAGQSLQAQMAAGANARGMGQAAAQMQAAQGVGQQQLGAMGQYAGMRGAEMGRAQGAYGQAGGTLREGDYAQQGMAQQRAEAQGQAAAAQQRLNLEAQMGYEQMGINNQQAQSDSDARNAAIRAQANADARNAHDAKNARDLQMVVGGMSAMATLGAGSDERMKEDVVPLYEAPGTERHYDRDVSSLRPDVNSGASLSGPSPRYSSAPKEAAPKAKTSMAQAAAKRRPSDAELKRMADEMLGTQQAQHAASLGDGPSVGRPAPAWLDDYMASDVRTKDGCRPLTADEKAQDEARTAAFMADAKGPPLYKAPASYEEASKAIDEKYEQERQVKESQKRRNEAEAAEYMARQDAELIRRTNEGSSPGFVKRWVVRGLEERAKNRTPEQNIELAVSRDKANVEAEKKRHEYDHLVPASLRGALEDAKPPRQPTSFVRGDENSLSDERTKRGVRPEDPMGRALEQGLRPFEYEYKPGFREAEGQQPGEKNVGPMAQNMAKNPITGSAVEQGPGGMLQLSIPKTVKMNSAGIGYLAAKQRKLEDELARVKGGR